MQNSLTLPNVTIITVVFNGVNTLEKTIQSVINQTYANKEYIIIDGGSTDGSIDIITRYEDSIDYWVSEADKGLYYAMNKGVKFANGTWVNFMNSGDDFYDNLTLEQIFSAEHTGVDVLFGDIMINFNGKNKVKVKTQKLDLFWKGMPFCHQACFVKKDLMLNYSFNTQYKLAADYESLYRMYVEHKIFKYLNIIVCNFLAGGLSDNNPEIILEYQKVIFPKQGNIKVRLFYYSRYLECFLKYNFVKIVGQSIYAYIRIVKNKFL